MLRAAPCAERFRIRFAPSLALCAAGFAMAAAAAAVEPAHTVAVLPFRVHSAKPVDYLGESISNLIRSRLEARGEVAVIDISLSAEASRQASDSDLRGLATGVGADTIVSGSLTELAGHFSLDVRVTPAAIGLRSHTFVLTAQRDDELLERVNELADQVLNQIVGAAPANVAEVQIVGPPEAMEDFAPLFQTQAGIHFSGVQARAIGRGFAEFVARSRITVWACIILPEHAHWVIARHDYPVERAVNLLKGQSTRQLIQQGVHPLAAYPTSTGRLPKMWGRGHWKGYLDSDSDIRRAIRYVQDNPAKEGKRPQRWSFVTSFDR